MWLLDLRLEVYISDIQFFLNLEVLAYITKLCEATVNLSEFYRLANI